MTSIVVAEDDTDIRELTVRMLRRAGYTVIAAIDGAEAWRAVLEHRPQLVISDVDMPVMSGVELCTAIRNDPDLAATPVIFISGSLLPGDSRAADAGASALLCKPFTAGALAAQVAEALDGHRADAGQP